LQISTMVLCMYVSFQFSTKSHIIAFLECPPFDNSSLRSVYHVRNVDIYRMKCLSKGDSRVDIIASHDWPLGIEQHGNTEELLRKKPYFRAEVERNDLGSPPSREVLDVVQPKWWFAAHLHVKFLATVKHQSDDDTKAADDTAKTAAQLIPSQVKAKTTTETPPKTSHLPDIDDTSEMTSGDDNQTDDAPEETAAKDNQTDEAPEENAANNNQTDDSPEMNAAKNDDNKETNFHALESSCNVEDLTTLMTKFLALDKCLPRRQYLSILHVECGSPKEDLRLEYDPEWLAILRKTHKLSYAERRRMETPETLEEISQEDVQWVVDRLKAKNGQDGETGFRTIPTNFQPTVPLYTDPLFQFGARCPHLPLMGNPHTDYLLELLELDHILTVPFDSSLTPDRISAILRGVESHHDEVVVADENEIDIDMDEVEDGADAVDENEIQIDEEDDEGSPVGNSSTDPSPDESVEDTAPTKKARTDT
jgi:lariat debranching enzyme